jgi:hypothetical protein
MECFDLIEAGSVAGSAGSYEPKTKALDYLQGIYNDPTQSTSLRMRAAIECLPYENPRLSATAIATMDGKSFAEALERCIERSQQGVPLLNGPVAELPTTVASRPFVRSNGRRYR